MILQRKLQLKADQNTAEKLAWLRLARTENVGPITFYRLIERFGSAGKAIEHLPEMSKRGGKAKPLTAPPVSAVEKEYEALRKIGGDIITAAEEAYPLALAAIDDAPPVISVLGNPGLMNKPCIAMVGARNASVNGRKFSEKLSKDLGTMGMVVVSGLARGIDTSAHIGALQAGTIAVVAGGIDIIYPEENKKLYEEIKEKGLLIAESPLSQTPFAQSFPRRNRIVSGLSKAVVVVEATMRSGSLITARLAGEQGRDLYAVPGHPLDPRAEGPNHLIREGAILIRNAEDIVENLRNFSGGALREPIQAQTRFMTPSAANENPLEDMDENTQEMVLSALSFTPLGVDELVRTCQLSVSMTQTVLLELELAGRVKRHHGNKVSLLQE
jgi:DNA processing protein